MTSSEGNRDVFDSVAGTYVDLELKPAERRALKELAPRLPDVDMLDLGVGAGRTGYTFSAVVRRYVGVDYAPRMLERARELLGDEGNVELLAGDARDLSPVEGEFDFVLFSFNGLDAVGHEDRLRVLAEVRRVLRPDGRFLFSSHQLAALPLPEKKARSPRFSGSRLYEAYARLRDLGYGRRIRRVNASVDLDAARERGWTIVEGIGHDFTVDDYYVDPAYQERQLREAGFELLAVYDVAGRDVTIPDTGNGPWLDYLCRPV